MLNITYSLSWFITGTGAFIQLKAFKNRCRNMDSTSKTR